MIVESSVRRDLDEAWELQLAFRHFLRPDADLLAVLPLQHQTCDQALAVFDRMGERVILAVELDAADGAFPVGLFQRIDQLVGIGRSAALDRVGDVIDLVIGGVAGIGRIVAELLFKTFGKDTNDASDGVLYQGVSGPGVAVTPKSIPFAEAFKKKFGNYPSYAGYTSYDEVYYLADAIKRAGSTDADKMVDALEKTDWEGTIGRIQFYGKDDEFTHGLKYGKGLITGLMLQWQDGKQVSVWPKEVAKGQLKFPSFIKVTSN